MLEPSPFSNTVKAISLFSIGAALALTSVATANETANAEVLSASFASDAEGVYDLLGGASVDGLDAGSISMRVQTPLPEGFEFGNTAFQAYSRFAPLEIFEEQGVLPWEPIAGQVTLLEFSKASNSALLEIELGVGSTGKSGGAAGHNWPIGKASLEVAIGLSGGMKLDETGEVVGAFSDAAFNVDAKYPDFFAAIDNASPSALTNTQVQIVRMDGSKEQVLFVKVLDNDGVSLGQGQAQAVAFGINEYVTELPLLAGNSDGFRIQISDIDGATLFTSKSFDAESTLHTDYQDLAEETPHTGALFMDFNTTKGGELVGPKIPLRLYSYCVPPVVHDHGASQLDDCGACSTATNPPAPNCFKGGKFVFYTAGYCKSGIFTFSACIEADEPVERTGPQYKYAGEETTTQGCAQFRVSLSYILGISGGVNRSKTCCKYEKCDMAGPRTLTMRTCRD